MSTPQTVAASFAATPGTLKLGRSTRRAGGKLRIAVVAPPWFAVPPPGYGGIERVVAYLVEGLCAAGHEVTLFASGGSRTSARLVSTYPEPPSKQLGDAAVEMAHTVHAFRMARRFDIIHDHTFLGLASGVLCSTPVVHTIHGLVTPELRRLYQAVSPPINLVTISEHQRSTLPTGVAARTIHNAIPLGEVPFGAVAKDYLLFVGRMNPDKGVLDAIEIARRSNHPLVIVAKVNEPPEQRYFDEQVKPALEGLDAEVFLQPPEDVKWRLYREAKATLFPIRWPEPFGLVMIESMASGTPVIAFRDGSVPEVIRDGETGYICDSVAGAVEAVGRVHRLSRAACRAHVAACFSAEAAVARHEDLYRAILEDGTTSRENPASDADALMPAGEGRGSAG